MPSQDQQKDNTQAYSAEEVESTLAMMQHQVSRENEMNNSATNLTDKKPFYWSLEQLQQATDGEFVGPVFEAQAVQFDSVSTDTRTIKPGALYIAIKGANFDGHDFIEEAVKQGAVAVLLSEPVDSIVPAVMVDDTRIALGQFGRWHRLQMPLKKLIGITGSNGKTTVKTLLAQIFALNGNTLATEGNLNNDFGVPRTLLNIRPEHDYAIIEMGANHLHEIGYLTRLALPDIAILNNASGAHLEGFGSLQGVIETKGEIFDGLNAQGKTDGVAIINTDSAGFDYWQNKIAHSNIQHCLSFGESPDANIRLLNCQTQTQPKLGLAIELQFSESSADNCLQSPEASNKVYRTLMPVLGEHNAMNAAACTAVALAAGLNWSQIEPALALFTGVGGRLQQNNIGCGWLLDDSYNANPESVKAGIKALRSLGGESIVCLGAMAEIGDDSDKAHIEIAEFAAQQGVTKLYVYGEKARHMPEHFAGESVCFESHQVMAEQLIHDIEQAVSQQQSLNVLVKGSRSARMELVTQTVLQKLDAK